MPRLLLVEDEAHLADGIRFNLELEGYEVEMIADGRTAVVRLAPEDPNEPALEHKIVVIGGIEAGRACVLMQRFFAISVGERRGDRFELPCDITFDSFYLPEKSGEMRELA